MSGLRSQTPLSSPSFGVWAHFIFICIQQIGALAMEFELRRLKANQKHIYRGRDVLYKLVCLQDQASYD